ncbi:MAG: hypothetical protein RL240_4125, partial [Planctomycetota bacterium]
DFGKDSGEPQSPNHDTAETSYDFGFGAVCDSPWFDRSELRGPVATRRQTGVERLTALGLGDLGS